MRSCIPTHAPNDIPQTQYSWDSDFGFATNLVQLPNLANSPSLPSCSPSDLPTPLKLNLRLENHYLKRIYEALMDRFPPCPGCA